jgi:hypothetical protein
MGKEQMIGHAVKIVALMLAVGLLLSEAVAQSSNSRPVTGYPIKDPKLARSSVDSSKNHFIEFRAAEFGSYGHGYVASAILIAEEI